MILFLCISEIFLLGFLFLLVDRKETKALEVKHKKLLKKLSLSILLLLILFGFYMSPTVGLIPLLVNMLYVSTIVFYPEKTVLLAFIWLLPLTLYYI